MFSCAPLVPCILGPIDFPSSLLATLLHAGGRHSQGTEPVAFSQQEQVPTLEEEVKYTPHPALSYVSALSI